jgi:predicted short-subunit dehydrogenase-like oxidoreductase (DUF2520 family)
MPMDYGNIPFLLEAASEHALQVISQVADGISGIFSVIDSDARLQVHMAAVFACNFSLHMAAVADRLMKEYGMDISLLESLIRQTYEKMIAMDPHLAQTGPAVRGDKTTINKHLVALKDKLPEKEIYKIVSENIARYGGHNE